MSAPLCFVCGQPVAPEDAEDSGPHGVAHETDGRCVVALKAALETSEADCDRYRAALGAAKDEVARLREELRIVSRYAARLYDAIGEVADVVSAGLGEATMEPAWVNAIQRGREGK